MPQIFLFLTENFAFNRINKFNNLSLLDFFSKNGLVQENKIELEFFEKKTFILNTFVFVKQKKINNKLD